MGYNGWLHFLTWLKVNVNFIVNNSYECTIICDNAKVLKNKHGERKNYLTRNLNVSSYIDANSLILLALE